MKIIISNLSEGSHVYDFSESAEELGLEGYRTDGDVRIRAELRKYGGQIQADLSFAGNFLFECDRCTKEIKIDVSGGFEVVYKYTKRHEDEDTKDENIFFISPETNNINIRDIIREYILLSVPMRKVPPEKDGICLGCNMKIDEIIRTGTKNEINPVWEKLLKNNK